MSWKIALEDERYYVDAESMPGVKKALRLAAAAPDLLEALENLLETSTGQGTHEQWLEAMDQARAAIAKAKGE